jgi:hypothetical protein
MQTQGDTKVERMLWLFFGAAIAYLLITDHRWWTGWLWS